MLGKCKRERVKTWISVYILQGLGKLYCLTASHASLLPSKVGKVLTQLHVKLLLELELFLYFMMFNGSVS